MTEGGIILYGAVLAMDLGVISWVVAEGQFTVITALLVAVTVFYAITGLPRRRSP